MPWVVGIDEAGYGPNLGPLVQTAAAVKLPEADAAGWDTLTTSVRRAHEPRDSRVLIDDSKLVHAGKNPLAKLEQGLSAAFGNFVSSVENWLAGFAVAGTLEDLAAEDWFLGNEQLPLFPAKKTKPFPVEARIVGAKLVPAPAFNAVVNASGSKATVLAIGLGDLLRASLAKLPADEPLHVFADKQGGRSHYAPILQGAFPEGWIVTELESAAESRYRILGLNREVTILFRPRADSASISVALASMLAKYLREVSMGQFNRFWERHVPGIKPTAGYPLDAKRFLEEIRPALERLQIPEEKVWRVK